MDDDPSPQPGLTLQGFGTLGVVRTNDQNAEYIRDLSQPKGASTNWTSRVDSLLGLQANLYISPQTEGVVQVVSRYHADATYTPELTWAFLRHDFSPDFSLRAGRLGTEFYMLGDSRLVGYSNLALRPPPDFYGSLVFSYIDGLDASATVPVGNGLLKAKLFTGISPEKSPYTPGLTWDHQGSQLLGGYLDYWRGPWQVRLSHAQVRFHNQTPTDSLLRMSGDPLSGISYFSLVPGMSMVDRWARFSSIGVVFDQGPLNIQCMLNQIKQDSPAYADSKAGYFMAAYSLGEFTPYFGASRSFTNAEPLPSSPVPGLDALTASLASRSYLDQHTYTLGGRWDLQKNLALKTQVDWIRGNPRSLFLYKQPNPAWDGNMTVYSLALDFVF